MTQTTHAQRYSSGRREIRKVKHRYTHSPRVTPQIQGGCPADPRGLGQRKSLFDVRGLGQRKSCMMSFEVKTSAPRSYMPRASSCIGQQMGSGEMIYVWAICCILLQRNATQGIKLSRTVPNAGSCRNLPSFA